MSCRLSRIRRPLSERSGSAAGYPAHSDNLTDFFAANR